MGMAAQWFLLLLHIGPCFVHYTINHDFNEIDMRIYLPESDILRGLAITDLLYDFPTVNERLG